MQSDIKRAFRAVQKALNEYGWRDKDEEFYEQRIAALLGRSKALLRAVVAEKTGIRPDGFVPLLTEKPEEEDQGEE